MSTATYIRWLWALIGAGVVVRLTLAFSTIGLSFDIHSLATVGAALTEPQPLELYDKVNEGESGIEGETLLRWPYAPGFFPWAALSTFLEHRTALPFHGLIQIPAIAADVLLTLLVQAYLGWRGSPVRTRLLAAGAVSIGPIFIAVSGYHGQIDSVAILPAVLALIVWEGHGGDLVRSLPSDRLRGAIARIQGRPGRALSSAVATGLLLGVAVAIKTPPILMLFALVPLAWSMQAAIKLTLSALLIPFVLLLPFAVADPDGVVQILDYRGAPGLGGVGLAIQPDLAEQWLIHEGGLRFSEASQFLFDWGPRLLALIMLAISAFILRSQPRAITAVVIIWVAFYAFSPNYFTQYLIWGMPFFLMAGYVRATIALQLIVVGPAVIQYATPWPNGDIAAAYVPPMLAVWVGFLFALGLLLRAAVAPATPAVAGPAANQRP